MLLVSGATKTMARFRGHPYLGELMRPGNGNRPSFPVWAADNGAFAGFDEAAFLAMLGRFSPAAAWVAAPDVVADAVATSTLFDEWEPRIRALGYRVAFVLQDGCAEVPWDRMECLFVGGSTSYKLSRAAARWMREAKARDKWVHVGRVNSVRRLRWCYDHGADSVDGTQVSMFPDRWLPWTLAALERLHAQTTLDVFR